jgi:primase-polymerase (primpol)-like protein
MMGSPEHVPSQLRQIEQWICWRTELRDGKQTKLPVEPGTGEFASTDDPSTWTSFREALEFAVESDAVEGVGFVFTEDDPFVGVDLDDCRDPESGHQNAWATDVIQILDSYTEISPSRTGAHVLIEGTIPGDHNRKDDIEIYETGRYFTVTGQPLPDWDGEVEHRQQELETVYEEYVARDDAPEMDTSWLEDDPDRNSAENPSPNGDSPQSKTTVSTAMPAENSESPSTNGQTPTDTTDMSKSSTQIRGLSELNAALVQRAMNAENGEKFERLWNGNWRGLGYESHSESDMGFCSMLAFWTGCDPHRIDAIFRESGLMREKWEEDRGTQTYGEITISKALNVVDETFDVERLESELKDDGADPTDASTAPSDDRSMSDQGSYDQPRPDRMEEKDPEVRKNPNKSAGHDREPSTDESHTSSSTAESAGGQGADRSSFSGPKSSTTRRTTETQHFEEWYTQLLDFQGSVPPWVEQIAKRIEELESEVDRNEQLIRHWREKAEEQEEEIKRLRRRLQRLEEDDTPIRRPDADLEVVDPGEQTGPLHEEGDPDSEDDDSSGFFNLF